MAETPEQIISDEDVARVHGFANFGTMSPRAVLAEGVLKYAMGYTCGSTMEAILREHRLITKPRRMNDPPRLTQLGQRYLRAAWPINRILGGETNG